MSSALPPLPAEAVSLLPALVQHSPDLILCFDAEGRYTYLNPAALRETGHSAQDGPARCLHEGQIFGADGTDALLAAVRQADQDDVAQLRFELTWRDAAARPRWHVCSLWREPGGARLLIARDITEHRLAEQALQVREREFRTLAENSPDNILRFGPDLRAVYCNKEIASRIRLDPASVVGLLPSESAPPGSIGVEAFEAQLSRTLSSGEVGGVEVQMPDCEGRLRTHSVIVSPEFDAAGQVQGAIAVGRDIQAYVDMRQTLANKEREFRSLAENTEDHIARWTVDGRLLYVNPALLRLLAPTAQAGQHLPPLPAADDRFDAILRCVQAVVASGQPMSLEQHIGAAAGALVHHLRFVPERDELGRICSVLGVGRDVTESVRQRELIAQLARTDALTLLANRQALYDEGPALLAAARRHGRHVGLMLLDLDQFKAVNDGMGHTAGDALLRALAQRLRSCVRDEDLLVRLGGDEFVVVVPDLDDAGQLARMAEQVHAALAAPVSIEGRQVRIGASVGLAVGPEDGDTLEALLANADTAMYHAKRSGRGRTQIYRRELSLAVRMRLDLEEAMRGAQHGEGLQLLFQPVITLAEGRVSGAEALLRWHGPHGLVMPDVFIPIAEETGMIVPMGRWVLRTAAEAVVRWNRERAVPLVVAVNVSTRQFVLDDVAQAVQECLEAAGCPAAWLVIEITESLLIEDEAVVQRSLAALRALGVHVAIDDFGTGYSALGYLARFDVDVLKIDRSFVNGIDAGRRQAELVKAFIAMAHALGLAVVAEGIETEAQARFLSDHGCAMGQGWLYGRPMPAQAFEALVGVSPAVVAFS